MESDRLTPAETGLRRPPSMFSRFVWLFFWFIMWVWAITGPINVVLGIVDLLFEPDWLNVGGANRDEKIRFLNFAIGASIIGGCFAWLRLSGDLKFYDDSVAEPKRKDGSTWRTDGETPDAGEFRQGPPPA